MSKCVMTLLEGALVYFFLKPEYDRLIGHGFNGGQAIMEMLKNRQVVDLVKQSNFIPDLIECLKENGDEKCNCN